MFHWLYSTIVSRDTYDLRVLPSLKKTKLTVMQVVGRDVILSPVRSTR